jgi:L-ascorbate metabolism protein UlaG (beta-lactamase superfamily)
VGLGWIHPTQLPAAIAAVRHRDDPAVQAELDWRHHDVDLPDGLELQWLGTAGFRLSYQGTTVLIDPYVSRASLGDVVRQRALRSDGGLVDVVLPHADAVLVGHTHFDHAVDVPHLATAHGCTVYGSSSVQHLLGLHGLADRAVVVEPRRRYEIGPFTVSFTPSVHSKLLAGLRVPAEGELTCDSLDHLGAGAYRCGQVWGITIEVAGTTLYHQGSADLLDDEVTTRGVDGLLCGIAGRLYSERFTERILRAVDPALVVAHHHDDFCRPVTGPMGFSFNVNLGGFVEEVARAAPGLPVRVLEPLGTVRGGGEP